MVSEHLQAFARKSDTPHPGTGSDPLAVVMPRLRDPAQILGLTTRLMKLFDGAWELADQSLHLMPAVGVHVAADARHGVIALDRMIAGLIETEPHLASWPSAGTT
jgi:predicted signal transduction protein with EAL and GGDEF domain